MAAWTDASREIDGKLEVQWDGVAWTNESSRLVDATGTMVTLPLWEFAGRRPIQPLWTAQFNMRSVSDRYSAKNSSSPLYADISANKGYGIPVRFSVGLWNGSSFDYTRVFTGRVDEIQLGSTANNTASFYCVDNGHKVVQSRHPTTVYIDTPMEQFFEIVANNGGISDVDMTLDKALFSIPFQWTDDEQIWEQLCLMAASEGGLIYFDQLGELIFENAENMASGTRHTVSQHTFDVSAAQDFSPQPRYQSTYNEIIVQSMPRAEYGRVILWEIDSAMKIAPQQTETISARLNYPQASLPVPVSGVDYHIRDKAGNDLSGDISIVMTKYAQRVELAITNNNTTQVAILYNFKLWGRPVAGRATNQEKLQATDADIGDPTTDEQKTLVIGQNPYIQLQTQARFLAEMMRDRTKISRWMYSIRGAWMIPDLIPMDLVTIVEAGSGINDTAYVQSVNWRYGDGQLRADYEAIDAGSWFPFSNYFILGTDTLGAGSTKRAWY